MDIDTALKEAMETAGAVGLSLVDYLESPGLKDAIDHPSRIENELNA